MVFGEVPLACGGISRKAVTLWPVTALPVLLFVAPAQAGVQGLWIPACAGMTDLGGKLFMLRWILLFVVS